ncbi:hypothetical protein [Rhodococcus sp. UNC23MFCrub1.1]|uniref:hypothetical protein n=1 Tax=Rhodococcus sp. UNC23MFCrub1.1 TaxID=1449068 RepID=UPI00047F7A77|nr:hypothetical protein [Rhodococcus sp. UNC23MFCrub1.1]
MFDVSAALRASGLSFTGAMVEMGWQSTNASVKVTTHQRLWYHNRITTSVNFRDKSPVKVDWSFTDATGDVYSLSDETSGEHTVDYNSDSPTLVRLTVKAEFSSPGPDPGPAPYHEQWAS